MKDTLYLNLETWDLEIDAFGNIAMAGTPYAQAQDVASACRLWKGEARYNTKVGVPYPSNILGNRPAPRMLAGWFEAQSKTVPGIKEATAVLQFSAAERSLGGQIQLTLTNGSVANVSL